MRFAVFSLAVAALSFFLGFQLGRGTPKIQATRERMEPSPPPASCAVSIDPNVLRVEIARALAAATPAVGGRGDGPTDNRVAAQASAAADPGPPPSPAQVAALDRGQALFDRLLRQGRMSAAESREFRDALANMDEGSRMETTRRLTQALNQEKIQPETHDLPF